MIKNFISYIINKSFFLSINMSTNYLRTKAYITYETMDNTFDEIDLYKNQFQTGTKVRLSFPFNGTKLDQQAVINLLELNKDYTIETTNINKGEVTIWIFGFPNHYFNGLQFSLSKDNKIITKGSSDWNKFYRKRKWENIKKKLSCFF